MGVRVGIFLHGLLLALETGFLRYHFLRASRPRLWAQGQRVSDCDSQGFFGLSSYLRMQWVT